MKYKQLTILLLALTSTLLIVMACEKDEDDSTTSFEHSPGDPLTDIEGNEYQTVWIGGQNWMAENLKTATYNDGTSIELAESSIDWNNYTSGAYCWYLNDQAQYAETYGALYNWYAVNTGNLCPDGWHVPTDEEWKNLEMELGMSHNIVNDTMDRGTNQGSLLAGNRGFWENGSLIQNDEFGKSGFLALPSGYRWFEGHYSQDSLSCIYWSASEYNNRIAWYRAISYDISSVIRYNQLKNYGFSVRCVKDE
jgi:uncharacterized protein (TIGR02145 family)